MAFAPKTPDRQPNAPPQQQQGKRVTAIVVASVIAFAHLCSKHASRVSKKLKPSAASPGPPPPPKPKRLELLKEHQQQQVPQSPRRLFATISSKAVTLVHRRKRPDDETIDGMDGDDWGDGGVWQRSILMGDKCQPLDFSGVIYYDSNGKQMSELPMRSPRASPLPGYLDRRLAN